MSYLCEYNTGCSAGITFDVHNDPDVYSTSASFGNSKENPVDIVLAQNKFNNDVDKRHLLMKHNARVHEGKSLSLEKKSSANLHIDGKGTDHIEGMHNMGSMGGVGIGMQKNGIIVTDVTTVILLFVLIFMLAMLLEYTHMQNMKEMFEMMKRQT